MSSLLLGVYDKKGTLVYAGSVGTGFNNKTLRDLFKRLKPPVCRTVLSRRAGK
ncbi:hypothetical protein [Massilia niabensis]|uniref:DNA ligase (ATP) n=1 Tax=Massilia niabensis TaxID=544910 RepID=A0ABW0L1S6_9BURK